MKSEGDVALARSLVTVASSHSTPVFFSVSVAKLCVLSFFSFGAYTLYWFYQNWKLVRDEHKEDVSPIARTILSNFYCYALFSRMIARGRDVHLSVFPAALCAVAWFVTNVLWRLPDPYWLVSTLSFLWLIPAQEYANRLNAIAVPHHERNTGYSAWNKALVGFGVVWWLLVLAGMFLPDPTDGVPKSRGSSPGAVQQHVAPDVLAFGAAPLRQGRG